MTTSGEALPGAFSLPGNSGQPQIWCWELHENAPDLCVWNNCRKNLYGNGPDLELGLMKGCTQQHRGDFGASQEFLVLKISKGEERET